MKYYIVVTPFFPEKESFRGPYILDQVKAIQRNSNYEVIVFKPTPFYRPLSDYVYDGIKVYRFKDYSVPSNMWPNKFCDWLTSQSLLRKIKSLEISLKDISIAHGHVTKQGAYTNFLKKRNSQIKSLVQHHGFDVLSITDGRFANFKFHKNQCISHGVKICNEANLNIGVSWKTLEYVLQQPNIQLKNHYVLYNGVDYGIFNKGLDDKKLQLKENSEDFRIGCIGNFWELKDQITLIKAVQILKERGFCNIKTIFIGSGYTLENCISYVKEQHLEEFIEFHSEVMHDQLPSFYRTLDLFVLPSYWEAFGCVYTEAYACGVPFIAVKGQGIGEIIAEEDQERWLIDKGDYKKLADLIERCISDPQQDMKLVSSMKIDDLIVSFLNYISTKLC